MKVYGVFVDWWDQWDNYGNGTQFMLKAFLKREDAISFLKDVDIQKIADDMVFFNHNLLVEVESDDEHRRFVDHGPEDTSESDIDATVEIREIEVEQSYTRT